LYRKRKSIRITSVTIVFFLLILEELHRKKAKIITACTPSSITIAFTPKSCMFLTVNSKNGCSHSPGVTNIAKVVSL
jgi:hypothetical protein